MSSRKVYYLMAEKARDEEGKVQHIVFDGVDHPIVGVLRRVLLATYNVRLGANLNREEIRIIEECVKPLFPIGKSDRCHVHFRLVLGSIREGTWHESRHHLLPDGEFDVLHEWIVSKVTEILFERRSCVMIGEPELGLVEASLRLAMLVLLPGDIENLPQQP